MGTTLGGGFASGLSAVHGALSRNVELDQRQVSADILRRADKNDQYFGERSRELQDQFGIGEGGDANDYVDQMVQAGRAGAVGSRVPADTQTGTMTPGADPFAAGQELLRSIDRAAGRQPGEQAPRRRADWDGYLRALVQEAHRSGDQQRVQQVLANTERTRRDVSQRMFALAHTAAVNGDAAGAARALNLANEFMPDGFANSFAPAPDGSGMILTRNHESGQGEPQTHRLTNEQVANFSMGMIDPQWQATYLFNQRKFAEEIRARRVQEGLAGDANRRANTEHGWRSEDRTNTQGAAAELAALEQARRALAADPQNPELRAAVEQRQRAYDVAAARAPQALPVLENIGLARAEQRTNEFNSEAQRRASAAMMAEEAARAAYDRSPTEANASALSAATDARREAEGRLTPQQLAQIRAIPRADRALELREAQVGVLTDMQRARQALREAQNDAQRAEAQERLRQGQERLALTAQRMAQQAGFTPSQTRDIATDVNTVIASAPEINGVAFDGTPQADSLRLWAAPIMANNRNLSPDAVARALVPFFADPSKFPTALSGFVQVGGQRINLPPELTAFIGERSRAAAAAAASSPQRSATGSSPGAVESVVESARRALNAPTGPSVTGSRPPTEVSEPVRRGLDTARGILLPPSRTTPEMQEGEAAATGGAIDRNLRR